MVRVEAGVQRMGGKMRVVETEDAVMRELPSSPALVIIDLGAQWLDYMAVIDACKRAHVPVIAFGPHADLGRQRDAARAGADFVFPRSKFMSDPTTSLREALSAAAHSA
jgi:hypothetical protein